MGKYGLKRFRKVNKLTQEDLGEYLNMSKGFLSRVENGKDKFPKMKFELLIANDRGWDTSMLLEPDESIVQNIGTNSGTAISGRNITIAGNLPDDERTIPLIPDQLQDESGVDITEYLEKNMLPRIPAISQFPTTTCYIRVKTSAMSPMMLPGDMLALKKVPLDAPIANGNAYVIVTHDIGMILRYVYNEGDILRLHAYDHERYTDISLAPSQVRDLYRVVGLIRTNF